MRKFLIVGGVLVGAAMAARRCTAAHDGFDFGKMIERMPENAPPKWMFRNVTAIRENTEHILELLEHQPEKAAKSRRAHPGGLVAGRKLS